MKDEDMLKDVLDTEKNIVANMAVALNEASCDNIYNAYLNIFEELSKEAKVLFNIAYNNSWYTLEESTTTKINTEYDKLSKELKNN